MQEDARNSFVLLIVILSFATEAAVTAVVIITIFVINPFMTVFVAVTLLLLLGVISKFLRPFLRMEGEIYQKSYDETNKWFLQSISGIKEVKASQAEGFFLENFIKYGKNGECFALE